MRTALLVAAVVWLGLLLWLVLPKPRVRLPDRVSDEWLTQHDQQDR
jgi:hypothetical protein